MKSVLISIRPQWCEKIMSGEKTIEVRKTAPKETPFKVYIYATRPKKYYKCGAVSTSDELLWLANGKIEMCDGFKFWANGEDFQCVNGKVIGEFICDKVYNLDYLPNEYSGKFGGEFEEMICKESCLSYDEIMQYKGKKPLYGWHISDLKIYDKPKELSEFYRICKNPCKPSNGRIFCLTTKSLKKNGCDGKITLTRPPQSYMFVEEVEQ